MINIRFDAKTPKVFVSISNLPNANKKALTAAFIEIGANLVRTTENSILNEPKKGLPYKRKGTGVIRISSAPGQAPALLTGQYFEGLKSIPNGSNGLQFVNYAPHAKYLEKGTKKMRPRPGMRKAIINNLRNNRNYINDSLNKAFK